VLVPPNITALIIFVNKSLTTSEPELLMDTAISENRYTVRVSIRNTTVDFNWSAASITIQIEY